ncbi:ABC transporter ATP-binding protein, partial [Streptococcus suis]
SYLMQIMFANIITSFRVMQSSSPAISIKLIRDVFDKEPPMTFKDVEDEELTCKIVFENFSFTYPHDKETTLKNI